MAAGAFVIVCKRSSFEVVGSASVAVAEIGLEQKSSLGAPRNAPLRTGRMPGAETALFLYHPYFSGAQRPDGERFNRRPSSKNVSAADFAPETERFARIVRLSRSPDDRGGRLRRGPQPSCGLLHHPGA